MSREEKARIIDQLQEVFSDCDVGILTDYRGLSTLEMTALRRRLGESGINYRVVKNTLARFAAERAGKKELTTFFDGPMAIASGYGDIIEPAKILADYIRTTKVSLGIKGGFFGDKLFTSEDITTLAILPPKEVLLAKIVSGMQSPIYALLNYLTTPLRGFAGVLQSRIQQLEGE